MGGAQRAVEQQQEARIRHHLISVKKTRLTELLHEGILSEQSHSEAGRLLDQELTENSKWSIHQVYAAFGNLAMPD